MESVNYIENLCKECEKSIERCKRSQQEDIKNNYLYNYYQGKIEAYTEIYHKLNGFSQRVELDVFNQVMEIVKKS